MELTVEKSGDVAVVVLPGDHLDASRAEEFKRDVAPLLATHPNVVFDMTRLTFVDSAGVGALLSCLRRLSDAGGDLKLFGLSKSVRAVFDMTRMHRIFDLFDTRDEAVQAFSQ